MFFRSLDHTRENAPVFRAFYMEIEIEIWMLRDERHVSAFRHVDLAVSLPYSQLR
jgi:hypothetical protein